MTVFTNLWWLIVAHGIGDLALQYESMGERKGTQPMVMLGHSVIWAGCLGAVLTYQNNFALWKMAFLVIVHFITDTISWNKTHRGKSWNKVNLIDQVAHFIQILVVMV